MCSLLTGKPWRHLCYVDPDDGRDSAAGLTAPEKGFSLSLGRERAKRFPWPIAAGRFPSALSELIAS